MKLVYVRFKFFNVFFQNLKKTFTFFELLRTFSRTLVARNVLGV